MKISILIRENHANHQESKVQNLGQRDFLQPAATGSAASMMGIPMRALAQAATGGVVVIGSTPKLRHLNSAVQSGMATMMPAAQWFASPIRMDANSKPQPHQAERWDLSPDKCSVTRGLPPCVRQRPSPLPLAHDQLKRWPPF